MLCCGGSCYIIALVILIIVTWVNQMLLWNFHCQHDLHVITHDGNWWDILFIPGACTPTLNGAPPNMLSPTALASIPMAQANGQAAEIYTNGIPHYAGMYS